MNSLWPWRAPQQRPAPRTFSHYSTPAVPDSLWYASDFLLGAGMVVIQPSTRKVVLLYDTEHKFWFLPKGRKDVGESLEQAALRETYEESGYRVEFLPLLTPSVSPYPPDAPPEAYSLPNTEPIAINTYAWYPRRNHRRQAVESGGEYLTHWYVGQIPEDAVRQEGTAMTDEQFYTSHLLTIDEATKKLPVEDNPVEGKVLQMAWALWSLTLREERKQREARSSGREHRH